MVCDDYSLKDTAESYGINCFPIRQVPFLLYTEQLKTTLQLFGVLGIQTFLTYAQLLVGKM